MDELQRRWSALTPAEKIELAADLKTSKVYLSQIVNGHRRASTDFARRLSETAGWPLRAIRPDVWTASDAA